jgi:YbgC/YbaW family acyl-CoA thioester hydrolase
MASEFTFRRRVEFCETDMAGIVHFSNYYRYMEQAEHEFLRSLGLALMMTEPDGTVLGWPRVSSSCSYKSPARYDDVLEIRLRVDRKGVKSLTFAFDIYHEERHVASGQLKTVCCRFAPGKPMESIEIPAIYGNAIDEAPPRKPL